MGFFKSLLAEAAGEVGQTAKSTPKKNVNKEKLDEFLNMLDRTFPSHKEEPTVKDAPVDAGGALFSQRLEALISAALQDGELTDKERELLKRRVEKEGEDWDEVEMIIDARLAEMKDSH